MKRLILPQTEVCDLYLKGRGIPFLAKEYNVSIPVIQRVLRENQVSTRTRKQARALVPSPRKKYYRDITGTKWQSWLHNAVDRHLEFQITKEYVWELYEQQDRRCALTNLPISFKVGDVSLDRRDSKMGYVEGNVQLVHKHVNTMKWNFDQNYFIQMCKLIAKHKSNE